MTTFSQIVDELTTEHVRPDLRASIGAYLNETIREVHFDNRNGGNTIVFYSGNRIEDVFSPLVLPALWPIPFVTRFQDLEAAYYVNRGCYAKRRKPGRAFERGYMNLEPYWYRSGPSLVFNGTAVGEEIRLSWFEYTRRFLYYDSATRPAEYNVESDSWTYLSAYDVDDDSREVARNLVSSWLLLNWTEVLKEGVRAKVFKRIGEDGRAKMCYSQFESLKAGLISAESYEMHE